MGFLKDDKGQKSLMRLITLLIVCAGLLWGFVEILAYLILKKYGVDYDIHETLILTTISIGVTGKGTQKAIEMLKKNNNDTPSH
jgi:hypothetical protein